MPGGFAGLAQDVIESAQKKIIPQLVEKPWAKAFFADQTLALGHPMIKAAEEMYHNEYMPLVQHFTKNGVIAAQSGGATVAPAAIEAAAHKEAYNATFGANNGADLHTIFDNIKRTAGKAVADNYADILHTRFKMAQPQNLETVTTSGRSVFANHTQMQKDLQWQPNAATRKAAATTGMQVRQPIAVPPSKYKAGNLVEHRVQGFNRVLAYKAALYHASGTVLNIYNSDGIKAVGRAIREASGTRGKTNELALLQSGAIGEMHLAPYRDAYNYQNSLFWQKTAKIIPGSLNEFLHRNIYTPGLPAVRRWNLITAANNGKYMAEVAAKEFEQVYKAAGPNAGALLANGQSVATPWVREALKRYNIDEAKLVSQGFKLVQDDIEKAWYHGANEHAFLHPYDSTPAFWRQHPFFRAIKTFTGFATKQSVFLRDDLMRKLRARDYVGLARTMTTLGLVYPTVGAIYQEINRLALGEDWDAPGGHLIERLRNTPAGMAIDAVNGNEVNTAKVMHNTATALARMSTFGMTSDYIRADMRGDLVQQFMPPVLRIGSEVAVDAGKAASYDENHPNAADPLGRDLLRYGVPFMGIGSNLAHDLLPTKAQRKEDEGRRSSRRKRERDPSSNPFNYAEKDFNVEE